MFTEHNKPQARSQNARIDHITAAVVERGLAFYNTLGRTVASAYFKENHVPAAVIGRLLASSGPRRTPPLPAVRRV